MTPAAAATLWHVLGIAAEAWGGASLIFTLLLLIGVVRRRPPVPAPRVWPAIAILRPCEGTEPELRENLLSSLRAPYPGPRRVLFLVPTADDPAYAVAQAVIATARAAGLDAAELLLTAPRPRQNRKVAQLRVGLSHCTEPVVVTVDSDVYLADGDLAALIAALQPDTDGRIAAAFAAPVEVAPQTRWDHRSAALVGASTQNFLALYGLYELYGGVPKMAGALCALRRDELLRIGGFDGVIDILGEDYELARRLTASGRRVALSAQPARCTDGGRSAKEVIARVARWMTVVRTQQPLLFLGYPLFVAATPAVLLWAAIFRTPVLLVFLPLLVLTRTLLAIALRRAQGLRRGPLDAIAEVMGAELLVWLSFGRALRTRSITWRGHRFQVGRGGVMIPLGEPRPDAQPADAPAPARGSLQDDLQPSPRVR